LTYPSLWRHATAHDLRWGISEAVGNVNLMRGSTVFPVDPSLLGTTIPVHAPWLFGWK
jgi:hypothetical protein